MHCKRTLCVAHQKGKRNGAKLHFDANCLYKLPVMVRSGFENPAKLIRIRPCDIILMLSLLYRNYERGEEEETAESCTSLMVQRDWWWEHIQV